RRASALPRSAIIQESLDNWGAIFVVPDLASGISLANTIAPEHMEVCTYSPWDILPRIHNAGAVFLGSHSPEPVGDYYAGPNHVLPTLGTAKHSSALSVQTFCKRSSIIAATAQFSQRFAASIARLARIEGLEAHAQSIESRI
ncbi:MAG: histidinol dehydrogenase, partial [Desulfovibrio sp.]